MLIVLGGFLGSGRRILAHKLSERLGFYYYDTEPKKLHYHARDRNGHVKEVTRDPSTDEDRIFLYEKILADFRLISKMHRDVVVDDGFHRAKPREYFFAEAQKYFGKLVFVWIDSDDEHVEDRLRFMRGRGMIQSVHGAMRRREQTQREFEPFSPPPLTFHHGLSDDRAVTDLIELIRKELPEIKEKVKVPA